MGYRILDRTSNEMRGMPTREAYGRPPQTDASKSVYVRKILQTVILKLMFRSLAAGRFGAIVPKDFGTFWSTKHLSLGLPTKRGPCQAPGFQPRVWVELGVLGRHNVDPRIINPFLLIGGVLLPGFSGWNQTTVGKPKTTPLSTNQGYFIGGQP